MPALLDSPERCCNQRRVIERRQFPCVDARRTRSSGFELIESPLALFLQLESRAPGKIVRWGNSSSEQGWA